MPNARTACAIFDLDGTLTDPKEGITACVRHAMSELGLPAPGGDLEWVIGPPLHESFAKILGTKDTQRVWQAIEVYRERYATLGKFENVVYAGVPECLARLREGGLRLFVATAKAEVYAHEIMEHFGLARFFEAVHGSGLDGSRTVKGDLLRHVLEREAIDPASAVMIGDRKHDVIGAKRCGLTCGGVLWGFGSPEELTEAGADALLPTPADVVSWLLG